jgi:hypothetical protein
MKKIDLTKKVLIVVLILLSNLLKAQTFSNSTAAAHDSWNSANAWGTAFSRSIVVSGLASSLSSSGTVLQQINLTLGNGVTTGLNLSTYAMRIKSPTGTIINICASGGFAATSVTNVNIKYRDDALLNAPSSSTQEPYSVGYYRVATSNSYSTVNGENPNGTWTFEMIEGTSTEIAFSKVELVFGPILTYQDITATTTNDACSSPQCISTGTILKATINGYSGNANDPNVSPTYPSGCQWNAAKNNSAWFYFTANSTTATITISGVSAIVQSLVVNAASQCVSGSQTVPTGGCPTDAVNDTYKSPRYSGTSGSSNNQQFNLSSLTPGNRYALVVDGNGGAISPLYIEMSGSTGSCSVPLPIELYSIYGRNLCDVNEINWRTASESNNDYFLLEESIDGELFVEVDRIDAIGNSTKNHSYSSTVSITGNSPIYYYRLSQVDVDGELTETKIISIKNTCNTDNINYKNEEIILTGYENIQSVEVYDLQGRKIIEGTSNVLNVSALSNSVYNVLVKANGEYFSKKIYKL